MTTQPCAAVTSVVIFINDAAELSFSDSTTLELSPCGASFVCQRPANRGQHLLEEGTRIQQRTEFATSEFKDKVHLALECRNRFAERPYLCRQFLPDGSTLQLFADIRAVKWPKSAETLPGGRQPDGSVKVTSVDECASLLLSQNKEEFTVEFLCKLSQKEFPKRTAEKHGKRNLQAEGDQDAAGRPSTDLQSNINKTAANSLSKLSQQNSPYLQTLTQRKDSLRKSQTLENQHKPSVDDCVEVHRASAHEVQEDHTSRNPEIEDIIAIKHGYTWVIQHHTVEQCPECWKEPLHLALNFDPKENHCTPSPNNEQKKLFNGRMVSDMITQTSKDKLLLASRVLKDLSLNKKIHAVSSENECSDKTSTTQQETVSDGVTSTLPVPLPLTCGASHLHRWRKNVAGVKQVDVVEEDIPVGQSIKVWFSNGIIYRLSRTPHPAVHIYPGDGTLIKSTGGSRGFFTHVIPRDGSLDERMLCVRSPPPDCPGVKYSMAGVLRKASRLLQNMMQADLTQMLREEKCCWKENSRSCPPTTPNPTVILEESQIEGLGSFVAFSNGRVRVVFSDRTTLDMEWDFRSRVEESYDGQDGQNIPGNPAAPVPRIRRSIFKSSLRKGVCKLLLPNGEQKLVPLENPQEYQRYVTVAVEWATWVASSPAERVNFYRLPESNSGQQDCAVETELQKIKCFEYILENTLSAGGGQQSQYTNVTSPLSKDTQMMTGVASGSLLQVPPTDEGKSSLTDPTPDFVRDALQRTSHTIRNIDSVLGQL